MDVFQVSFARGCIVAHLLCGVSCDVWEKRQTLQAIYFKVCSGTEQSLSCISEKLGRRLVLL
jgi:hypothetical protein